MTVVACARFGDWAEMAADSSVSGDEVVALTAEKVFVVGDTLVGICGSLRFNDAAHRYRDSWRIDNVADPKRKLQKLAAKMRKEFPPKDDESFEFLVCTARHIFLIDTTYAVVELATNYHAIGSGSLGALAVLCYQEESASLMPRWAVESVIPHCTDVKGPVRIFVVGGGASQETCADRQKQNKKSGRKSSKRPASTT